MEAYSVLKTPAYGRYGGRQSTLTHTPGDYNYAIAYYEPIYDYDLKIPGLGIAQVPFVPIGHIRRRPKPFVPRNLTEEDMIQINIRAEQRARDILKDFHPAQKASYESASDFIKKKEIESKLEEIRDTCTNIHSLCRKTGNYDITRGQLYGQKRRKEFTRKSYTNDDLILSSHLEHIDDLKHNMSKDLFNRKDKFQFKNAGAKSIPRTVKVEEKPEEKVEEKTEEESSTSVGRRSSRDVRQETLKNLKGRQENQSDCFERTYGRYLSKLRGDINSLSTRTSSY
jgi:hypothetical protein